MVVIHISGTTGSGKSWISLLMKRIYPTAKLYVIDIDQLFRDEIDRAANVAADKQFEQIERNIKAFFARLRKKHKNILITGYSDIVVGDKVRYIELDADIKYFIDIPLPQLIHQYRMRAGYHIMHTRHEHRSMSDDDLRKLVTKDKQVYKSFKVMPQSQIIKEVILKIGN